MKEGPNQNEAAQGRIEKRREAKVRQAQADLGAVLATPQGRRVLRRIIYDPALCNLRGGSKAYRQDLLVSVEQTFVNEGKREIGLTLDEELHRLFPELYEQLISEAFAERREDDVHRRHALSQAETEDDET